MSTLHLGVIDVPYKDGTGTSTSEVAEELEKEYQVIFEFYKKYKKQINQIIEESIEKEMERILKSKKFSIGFINTSKIEALFRKYIDSNEWTKITGRVITAAILGHSKRYKDRYNRKGNRGARPAFIDTGLYQASFKSWID